MDINKLKETNHKYLVLIVFSVFFITSLLVWFFLYSYFGYNQITMTIATVLNPIIALIFIYYLKIDLNKIGLSVNKLSQALIIITSAYLLLYLLGIILNRLGANLITLRESYNFYYLLDNWILTGLGEELLFAGLLFNLLLRKGKIQKTWLVVMTIAFLFAIWHLPKHLAIMINSGNVSFDFLFSLLMNVLSWNIFGWLYVKSQKNLWLVAFAHASTDYALLPMIVRNPVMGIVFMLSLFIFIIAYRKIFSK